MISWRGTSGNAHAQSTAAECRGYKKRALSRLALLRRLRFWRVDNSQNTAIRQSPNRNYRKMGRIDPLNSPSFLSDPTIARSAL